MSNRLLRFFETVLKTMPACFDVGTRNRWNEDAFGPHFKATPLEGIVAPLTETGIEVVFTPEGVDDDIRREGVLCTIEVRNEIPWCPLKKQRIFLRLFAPTNSLLVVTQIRGSHGSLFSPLPTTLRALHCYRDKGSALSSVVDSRQIVLRKT